MRTDVLFIGGPSDGRRLPDPGQPCYPVEDPPRGSMYDVPLSLDKVREKQCYRTMYYRLLFGFGRAQFVVYTTAGMTVAEAIERMLASYRGGTSNAATDVAAYAAVGRHGGQV